MRALLRAAGIALATLSACSSFSAADDPAPPPEGGAGDGATPSPDGGGSTDASSEGPGGPPTVLTNGDFELGSFTTGCAPGWIIGEGDVSRASGAGRNGTFGCQLCVTTTGAATVRSVEVVTKAGVYTGRVFVRMGDAPAVLPVEAFIDVEIPNRSKSTRSSFESPVSDFQPRLTSIMAEPGDMISLVLTTKGLKNACAVFDDATLTPPP